MYFFIVESGFHSCCINYGCGLLSVYRSHSLLLSYFYSCRYCSVQYRKSTLSNQEELRMIRILDKTDTKHYGDSSM